MLIFLFPVLTPCSNSNHGAPTGHSSCGRSSCPCTRSPSVQICCRSPQHPATYDYSTTSSHAAGRTYILVSVLTHSGFHVSKLSAYVRSKFSVLRVNSLAPPPACSSCSGTGASDCLHAGCCSASRTEADAG